MFQYCSRQWRFGGDKGKEQIISMSFPGSVGATWMNFKRRRGYSGVK